MRPGYATAVVALALTMIALFATVTSVGAFPADATKTGQPCSTCHVNPAGGPQLTATGTAYQKAGRVWPVPAAAAPAAPAPAAPAAAAPTTAAPTAPAAAPAGGAAAGQAPGTLPKTGEAEVLSAVPTILSLFGFFATSLGIGLARRREE